MKKYIRLITFSLLCLLPIENLSAQTDSIIGSFMQKNPKMMTIGILQEETLLLATDANQLLVVLDVSNPQLLLRLVMQGFSIYVDPTGRQKEKHEIRFASAAELDLEALGLDSRKPEAMDSTNEKPNILPLIEPISQKGGCYTVNNKVVPDISCSMSLDVETDHLYYYMLLPVDRLLGEKKLKPEWSIGFYVPFGEMQGNAGQMMPPPPMPGEGGQPQEPEGEISEWIRFSFEELAGMNLK